MSIPGITPSVENETTGSENMTNKEVNDKFVCCECESYEDQDNCEVCQNYLWHEAWQRDNQ
jgi:hypothetical protein